MDHLIMNYPNMLHNNSNNTSFTSLDNSQESSYNDHSKFEVPDQFFDINDWILDHPSLMNISTYPQHQTCDLDEVVNSFGNSSYHQELAPRDDRNIIKQKKDMKEKVAFRTMSQVEILDDGFKWRKYGKKMVKNSPNPRNYYKCSAGNCPVKKRVERDNDDSRYVITTYEGIHTHMGPTQI